MEGFVNIFLERSFKYVSKDDIFRNVDAGTLEAFPEKHEGLYKPIPFGGVSLVKVKRSRKHSL